MQRAQLGIVSKGRLARRNAMRTEEDYWGTRDAQRTEAAQKTELELMLEDEEQLRDALLSFDAAYHEQHTPHATETSTADGNSH